MNDEIGRVWKEAYETFIDAQSQLLHEDLRRTTETEARTVGVWTENETRELPVTTRGEVPPHRDPHRPVPQLFPCGFAYRDLGACKKLQALRLGFQPCMLTQSLLLTSTRLRATSTHVTKRFFMCATRRTLLLPAVKVHTVTDDIEHST
jgi:hypothetical protein